MVIRNGFFSFRWSDIWASVYPEACGRSPELIVLKARPVEEGPRSAYHPVPVEEAVAQIREVRPCVVFAPHVETSAGMIISDEYIKGLADAVHEQEDALFVLDCIASGNAWVDMRALGVDVLITAPQKGWSGPACVGIAMMSERATAVMAKQNAEKMRGHSFSCSLAKWHAVAQAYKKEGGFMYYTTLPTDALMTFRDCILETKAFGYDECQKRMTDMGSAVRAILEERGFKSVAADGNKASTVVVSYMRDDGDKDIIAKFKQHGIQLAAGVPLKVDEAWEGPPPTFRIGLFGLDKLKDVEKTVGIFKAALDDICK
jgi:aspartate aminotransferase-like enzyme